MRWLINYLRQCFCKHDFTKEEREYVRTNELGGRQDNTRVSLVCSKCGYYKKFWKF